MPDYNLDDLLSALNEVAADTDPNDDPDNDDSHDPNYDDWDREQGEDDEQDDGDDNDEGDYSHSPVPTIMRLQKLEAEAERWTFNQRIAQARQQPKPQLSKANHNMSKIADLRWKTHKMNYEMETDKMLVAETKKHRDASAAFYFANLTPAEKREHDEDAANRGTLFSNLPRGIRKLAGGCHSGISEQAAVVIYPGSE
jgi:hypothetical protein